MSLHPLPGTPMWALYLHIAGGTLGIVFGAAALAVRKGEPWHRGLGTGFVAAMLTMATMATFLGLVLPQWSNFTGGIFAFYLVSTAWVTVKRPEGRVGSFERIAMLVAAAVVAFELWFGWIATQSPSGSFDRFGPEFYFVAAALMAIGPALDLNMITHRGLVGRPRIARHVWRMCTALFFASGSFFIGQQKVMPEWMRGSPVLIALALAPLVLMLFWLGRVALTRQFRTEVLAA